MTDAREIIARHLCTMAAQGWSGISAFERAAYRTTAAGMVEAVTSAGYRILGPDEVDPVTVEKCAEVVAAEHARCRDEAKLAENAGDKAKMVECMGFGGTCVLLYTAIRAIGRKA